VAEAKKRGIPVVAIVDSNASPEGIDYVIPGNDDAMRAIQLYVAAIADSIMEAKGASATAVQEEEFAPAEAGAES
jgi:small subunit ribosomal protein S2